ncbi:hypothetical protein KCU64_g4448, partial [Aureobasidium melanogenum]
RHGTKELFDDDGDKDIKYDSASIDRLLEVSHIEHTKAGEDKSAESTFSFARVWANNELEETTIEGPEAAEIAPDRDVWDKILKERERIAAVEAAAAEQAFGRGRRAKATIDYDDGTNQDGPDNIEGPKGTDEGSPVRVSKRAQLDEDYDTDFQADSDEESIAAEEIEDVVDPGELQIPDQPKTASKLVRPPGKELSLKKTPTKPRKSPKKTKSAVSTPKKKAASTPKKKKRTVPATPGSVARRAQTPFTPTASNARKAREAQMNMQQYGAAAATAGFIDLTADSDDDVSNIAPQTFRRVDVPKYRNYDPEFTIPASNGNPPRKPQMVSCVACQHLHPLGSCPLKRVGVECCGLCGLAHYGFSRICPHINSETQVREMIRAVKLSSEPGHLKSETLKYLTGLKGTLVQKKKKEAEKKAAAANGSTNPSAGPPAVPGQQPFHVM